MSKVQISVENGSFRDPKNFIFYADDKVYRAITQHGKNDFVSVRKKKFLTSL